MLLYDYQVGDQFLQVRELADRFREKFQAGASPEELLLDRRVLEGAYDQLDRLLPEAVGRGHLARHLYWIEYWLNQNEPERCSGDVESICTIDLPRLEQGFRQWCGSRDHYDRQFADEIAPLLRDRHLDSAVRRAFVILKQRLVDLFGLPMALDGSQLVNEIFGTQGRLAGRVPREETTSTPEPARRPVWSVPQHLRTPKRGAGLVRGRGYSQHGQLGFEVRRAIPYALATDAASDHGYRLFESYRPRRLPQGLA